MAQTPIQNAIRKKIPEVYSHLLPVFFQAPLPEEALASCSSCAMTRRGSEGGGGGDFVFFEEGVKCCSYLPTLPNVLVGAILAERRVTFAEGKRRVLASIDKGEGVTRLGVGPGAVEAADYAARGPAAFGRSTEFLCPYFAQGGCSIWPNRTGVCSTFFCKFSSGAAGYEFWQRLAAYLLHCENTLAAHCADMLPDGPSDAAFFLACRDLVAGLTEAEFATVLGERGRELQERLEVAYGKLGTRSLPKRLKLNPKSAIRLAWGGGARIVTYAETDPTHASDLVLKVLEAAKMGGGPEEIKQAAFRDHNLEIEDDFLVELLRRGILVDDSSR